MDQQDSPPNSTDRCRSKAHRTLPAVLGLLMAACGPQEEGSRLDGQLNPTAAKLRVSDSEAAVISDYLSNRVPASAIRATLREGAEVVDCVDALEQPAMRALRRQQGANAKLPTPPVLGPQGQASPGAPKRADRPTKRGRMGLTGCPDGTVPIRRVSAEEIMSYGSLAAYLRRSPPRVAPPQVGGSTGYRYTKVDRSIANWGMEANLSLWNNQEIASGDHSVSQIFALRGSGGDIQTVEAGWVKRPGGVAKLFAFTTNDNYINDQCWNTDCFVMQSGSPFTLDLGWDVYSQIDGNQYDNLMLLYKDGANGDWWLRIDGSWVGCWPRSRFDSAGLQSEAAYIGSQGEVYQSAATTTTDMGSGRPASDWYQKAAYQKGLQYVDTSNFYQSASSFGSSATHSSCYSIIAGMDTSSDWQRYFFFGGGSCM
jgi:hypothetical protein